MRDLLFVIPPYFNAADYLDKERAAVLPAFTIPYGILSMEAYFKEHGRTRGELSTLDLNITLNRLVEGRSVDDFRAVFRAEALSVLERDRPQVVGVSAVALAVESGSDYVLDKLIQKPLKKRLIQPAVDALRKVGVRSHVLPETSLAAVEA